MKSSLPRFTFLAVLALLVSVSSVARAQTILPPLQGDNQSEAFSINNRGEVAGTSAFEGTFPFDDFIPNAVVWDLNGNIIRVLEPLENDDDSAVGEGNSINNNGSVAGRSIASDGTWTAVAWDRNGVPTALLPLPGHTQSRAEGITTRGGFTVAGTSFGDGSRAVVWDLKGDGTPRALALLAGDTSSGATGINERGQVVGASVGGGTATAVVWDRTGTPTALSPLPGDTSSVVSAINNAGQVVGTSIASDFSTTAVVWNPSGRSYGMPTALPPLPGGGTQTSAAFAINNRGEIVGEAQASGEFFAVIWDRDGTPTVLPGLNACFGVFDVAYGINARGDVAGRCFFDTGDPFLLRAVVWR
jgi:uncharacterized membrane protein